MFKVGDRVKYKSGTAFSNGEFVNTVEKVSEENKVWFMETGKWARAQSIEHASPATSPVRTVTRREIVPGTYGRIVVTGTYKESRVTLNWEGSSSIHTAVEIVGLDAEELREAAHLFSQLAEVLEENAK